MQNLFDYIVLLTITCLLLSLGIVFLWLIASEICGRIRNEYLKISLISCLIVAGASIITGLIVLEQNNLLY